MNLCFSEVMIGEKFHCNGNDCVKKSSRTALVIKFNKVFYFGKNETVNKIEN